MTSKIICAAVAGVLSVAAAAASAQSGGGSPIVAGAADSSVLRAGAPIALKMAEPLTTKGKTLRVGYRFQMEVAEPVMLNNQVVIPAGSPAVGEVTDVRNKGMWGKSGRIGARVLYVRVNGRQIRLTGLVDDKGVTGTAGVVGAAVLVPLAGFLMTGTSATIPMGAPVKGFIDEDVPVTFEAGAPAPMKVPAPDAK
jgi:hypothetical protein